MIKKSEISLSLIIIQSIICPFEHTQNNKQISFSWRYSRVTVRVYSCWNTWHYLQMWTTEETGVPQYSIFPGKKGYFGRFSLVNLLDF